MNESMLIKKLEGMEMTKEERKGNGQAERHLSIHKVLEISCFSFSRQ